MNKIVTTIAAAAFALGAISAFGAELTNEERAEMRQRAERLQTEQARNPTAPSDLRLNQQRGDVRLDRQRSDVRMDRQRAEVKTKKGKSAKAKGRYGKRTVKKSKNAKRSIRDLPGALCRFSETRARTTVGTAMHRGVQARGHFACDAGLSCRRSRRHRRRRHARQVGARLTATSIR